MADLLPEVESRRPHGVVPVRGWKILGRLAWVMQERGACGRGWKRLGDGLSKESLSKPSTLAKGAQKGQ